MILDHGSDAEAAHSNKDIEAIQAQAGGIHAIVIRWLTGLLIFVLCLWMLAGIGEFVVGLYGAVSGNWRRAGEHMIVSVLVMLAQLEIMRTLLAYRKLGRVRVTFIIDTALVVLIGELIGLWFGEYSPQKVLLSLGVIATLVILRNITAGTRFRIHSTIFPGLRRPRHFCPVQHEFWSSVACEMVICRGAKYRSNLLRSSD